jgi:hypothetical protein
MTKAEKNPQGMAQFAEVFPKGWLNKHKRGQREAEPLGIILCAGKKREVIELLELNRSGIHVADYLTELPPKALLEQKLHSAMESARARLGASSNLGEQA